MTPRFKNVNNIEDFVNENFEAYSTTQAIEEDPAYKESDIKSPIEKGFIKGYKWAIQDLSNLIFDDTTNEDIEPMEVIQVMLCNLTEQLWSILDNEYEDKDCKKITDKIKEWKKEGMKEIAMKTAKQVTCYDEKEAELNRDRDGDIAPNNYYFNVQKELKEVSEKISKLMKFNLSKEYYKVSQDQRSLLERQIEYMQSYAKTLQQRLIQMDKDSNKLYD